MRVIVRTLFIFFAIVAAHAQTSKDSLYSVWKNETQADTVRIAAYVKYIRDNFLFSNPDSALILADDLFRYAKERNSLLAEAEGYRLKGNATYLKGIYPPSLKFHEKALKTFEAAGFKKGYANSLANIGTLHKEQGNFPMALEYIERTQKILDEIDYKQLRVYIDGMSGSIYKEKGDYPRALEFYEKALALSEAFGFKQGIANNLGNIGSVFLLQENYSDALAYHQMSLKIAEEIDDKQQITNSLLSIGNIYREQKEYSNALEYCQRGLNVAKEMEALEIEKGACQCLYNTYKAMDREDEALVYLEKVLAIEDSLDSKQVSKMLEHMEFTKIIQQDSITKAEEVRLVQAAHKEEMLKEEKTRNIFVALGLIVLILAIGLVFRLRYMRRTSAIIQAEKEKAQASERAKHQFLANMSHEIRTPMNAIKGMTNILLRRNPMEEQKEYLYGISQSCDSLLVIINDILDISKIEAGKIELEKESLSINELVNNVHLMMQFKAEEKGLELIKDIPEETIQVNGDSTRLRQILVNLIGNAIKFTEKGAVTTKFKVSEQGVHFTVSDTGIGIGEDRLEKIFESFEQAYADTTRKFGGTGLGLSISKRLVELHGGRIWVESQKDKGSQFHFIIPYEMTKKQERETLSTDSRRNMAEELKGINILLVEDNQFNIIVAQEELEDAIEGVHLDLAENGAIAVEKVQSGHYDVILMDVQMPKMSGYEATKVIRGLQNDKAKLPIIAMTANVLKEDVDACYNAGMDDFIGKPFDIDELIQKIHNLIFFNHAGRS